MRRAFRQRDLSLEPKSANGYKAAIHILATSLGLAKDVRQDLQRNLTGYESCADMNLDQLRAVHHRLQSLSGILPHAKPYVLKKSSRPGRDERLPEAEITKEQQDKINHLFLDIETQAGKPFRPTWRMSFCRRLTGSSWPQNRQQANRVIEALKQMRARHWTPRAVS